MRYTHEDGTLFTKEEFLQKLKTDKEFNDEFGNKGIDQIQNLINDLRTNPDSRRLMVNAWNVGELDKMTLPPCHYGFQVYTRELSLEERLCIADKFNPLIREDCLTKTHHPDETEELKLVYRHEFLDSLGPNVVPQRRAISLMFNMRSIDTFLGLPFNIASYGLLLEIIAKEVNMVPDELIGNLGDTHLYLNHIEQAKEQIGKNKLWKIYKLKIQSPDGEKEAKALINIKMKSKFYSKNTRPFKEKLKSFSQSLLFWKGRSKGIVHTRNLEWDDLQYIFFPKKLERYGYLGITFYKEDSEYYKAIYPLVLAMDYEAKPKWCPRWFLRFLHVFGDDKSVVRVRNHKLSHLHRRLTKGISFWDWKTKWSNYDLRISISAPRHLQDLADDIEHGFYSRGRQKELVEQIKELDSNASIIWGSIKRLEEQLELLQNRITE